MTTNVKYDVLDLPSNLQDWADLRSTHEYFEKELGKLSIEKLWEIIDELLLLSSHDVPNKTKMSYEHVLGLCIVLKEADDMFRNLEQIAILQNGIDKASNHDS